MSGKMGAQIAEGIEKSIPEEYRDLELVPFRDFLKILKKGFKDQGFRAYIRLIPENGLVYASWDIKKKGKDLGLEYETEIEMQLLTRLEMKTQLIDEPFRYSRTKEIKSISFHSYGDSRILFSFLSLTKGEKLNITVYANNTFTLIEKANLNMETIIIKSDIYEIQFDQIYEPFSTCRGRAHIKTKLD